MDIVDVGACTLDPTTNALLAQCKASQMGDDPDDAPDFGPTPVFGALGVTAVPYPRTDEGGAQGALDEAMPGTNGAIVGMRDTRQASAGVVEKLAPGEAALHSTGPDFDSRVFVKKQLAAIVVGDDVAFVIDRDNKRVTLSAFGMHFEMSAANGIVFTDGQGASLQLQGGGAMLGGNHTVLGGRTPTSPVGLPGSPSLPAPGVFVGS